MYLMYGCHTYHAVIYWVPCRGYIWYGTWDINRSYILCETDSHMSSMALWAALSLIVIMVSCFGDGIKPWPYYLFPFSLVVSPLSNFANVYNVGNIPLSFFKKIKKTHIDTKFRVGMELLPSAAPFWKKMGGGKLSSSFYFISPSLLITIITMVQ